MSRMGKMLPVVLVLILLGWGAGLEAQTPTPSTQTQAQPAAGDSLKSSKSPGDTLAGPKSRADTVLVVRHRFNHREQIITGSVVMSCLALMMVVMNNYNPR